MVNIREIELFDYIKIHNNKLCKKIYRLEISNLPYIVYKSDLDEVYKVVWYINYKYNIVGYKGTIVEKMLNDRIDEIIYNKEDCAIMTATNYIDFELSNYEHEEFTLKYNDTLRTIYYLLTNKTGLIVNKKGMISLIAELYNIDLSKQYTDKNKQYEIYIKDSSYYRTILGYLKKELHIDDLIKDTIDVESITYMLFNATYNSFGMETNEYYSYLSAIKENYESKKYDEVDEEELVFNSLSLSPSDLETLRSVRDSLSRTIEPIEWWELQDTLPITIYPP